MKSNKFDLIIIWAWSAWYPAGMYASRYKIKNLIIWAQPGWALATSHKVENYPWTISASWKEIMDNFKEHAITSGSEIIETMATDLKKTEAWFRVKVTSWDEYESKYIVLATWNSYRKLGFKGENEYLWKWVSYCATCDWMFFKDRDVVIVWWWNTALTEALYLSEICSKVYVVHRRGTFRAEDIWIEQANKKENIEFVLNEEIEEVRWKLFMEETVLKSGKVIKSDWIFVAIWSDPNTTLVDEFDLQKDDEGCLVVDKRQETWLKWLYAAWDVSTNSNKFKQTIMSAAEWCLAADSIHEDIIRW